MQTATFNFGITVDRVPIGYKMWQSSKYRKPSIFNPDDSPQVVAVKDLAFRMISYNKDDRPSAKEVLHEMTALRGKVSFYGIYINHRM